MGEGKASSVRPPAYKPTLSLPLHPPVCRRVLFVFRPE